MKPYLHNSGPGVIIGVPTLGRAVPIQWAFSLKSMNPPTNFNVIFHVIQNKPIDEARDEFAKFAIEKDAKYLFMLGDDVVAPNHALRQLIFRMEQNPSLGVVGGIYCTKVIPSEPLVYRGNGQGAYWDWKVGEFFEVSGLGMDCTLIRVDLLKKLGKNWFKTINDDKYLDAVNNAESWTEDLYFCKRVSEETEYKIYADSSILCEHWDINSGTFYKLPIGSLPLRRIEIDGALKQCLFINPSDTQIQTDGFQVTTFGDSEIYDYRGSKYQLPFDDDQFDWVVVGDNKLSTEIEEYKRVCKDKGLITLNYHCLIDRQVVSAKIENSKIRDGFIEIEVKK